MVEATVQMKNGDIYTAYARSFESLFRKLEGKDVVKIIGRTIKMSDMRQGKENLTDGNTL